jgi:hypothetical protein
MRIQKQAARPKRSARRVASDDFFDLPKAMRFIDKCERDDLAILGIEGFVREPDGVRPQLDLIADFSPKGVVGEETWEEYRPQVNQTARKFLKFAQSTPNVVFEFVTWSKDDWLVRGRPIAAGK